MQDSKSIADEWGIPEDMEDDFLFYNGIPVHIWEKEHPSTPDIHFHACPGCGSRHVIFSMEAGVPGNTWNGDWGYACLSCSLKFDPFQ